MPPYTLTLGFALHCSFNLAGKQETLIVAETAVPMAALLQLTDEWWVVAFRAMCYVTTTWQSMMAMELQAAAWTDL